MAKGQSCRVWRRCQGKQGCWRGTAGQSAAQRVSSLACLGPLTLTSHPGLGPVLPQKAEIWGHRAHRTSGSLEVKVGRLGCTSAMSPVQPPPPANAERMGRGGASIGVQGAPPPPILAVCSGWKQEFGTYRKIEEATRPRLFCWGN